VSDDDLISASKEGVAVVLLEGAGEPEGILLALGLVTAARRSIVSVV